MSERMHIIDLCQKYTTAEIRKMMLDITCDPCLAAIVIELAMRVETLEKRKPSYVPSPTFGAM